MERWTELTNERAKPSNLMKIILRATLGSPLFGLFRFAFPACLTRLVAADEYEANLGTVTRKAQAAAVKIYGAGGSGLEAYQSGFLVSPDGHIATAWSTVLDVDPKIVLDDGRTVRWHHCRFEPNWLWQ